MCPYIFGILTYATGLPTDGSRWGTKHVQTYLNNFAKKHKLSETHRQSLIHQLGTLTGKQLFELDKKRINQLITNPDIAKKFYSDLGGTFQF